MSNYKKLLVSGLLALLFLFGSRPASSQDTLSINLTEFIDRGLKNSGQVAYESGKVDLAENRIQEMRGQRILPRFELNTQHGVVPGVKTNVPGLGDGELYLDPDLSNDWENWAVFTRAEISATQPIFTWGALSNAVKAAEAGAKSAQYEFGAVKAEAELRLFDLYYSYLLAIEISRILEDANSQLGTVQNTIDEMREDGSSDLKESDVFKFQIFQAEFVTRRTEVEESLAYIRRVWNYALQSEPGVTYVPESNFLDPVPYELEDYSYYLETAMDERPEMLGVEYGITALENRLEAEKAQQYPLLFLGVTGSFAHTPNRPRQTNPFIRNTTNYGNVGIGFGIRQNLNIFSMRASVDKARIEYKRVNDLEKALSDGIILDLNDRYREAVVAETRMQQTEEALVTARQWVRNEQLNYDIGFGDVEDLLDAVQKELELRVQLKQNIFDLNKKVAALHRAGGLPISQLNLN
ncbi:TolC family protein [Rhodohalobacter sp. 614A]|uniref:TolC family protein n=1 Tax=Rhodohalobacter sp. 614A TaxID=2908649 RepID=UPI001F46C2D2|nr:TolC family protein [Rhodohalobacter sp. 614A]